MSTWLPDASCDAIIQELVTYLQKTKEEEEEDQKLAEFVAKASPAILALPGRTVSETPTAHSPEDAGCFMGGSLTPIPQRAAGFTPVQAATMQAVREAQQTRLFAFALQHGDAVPELETVANAPRDELSVEMSQLADMMEGIQLESPAVSSPLELDEEAQQLSELSELDDLLRETEEMEDADETMAAREASPTIPRSDRDGVAAQVELESQVQSSMEARAAALSRKTAAAIPAPPVEGPPLDTAFPSPSTRTAATATPTPDDAENWMAFADANLLETPYLQSRLFIEPDVETPDGTFLFASSSPPPVLRDVTNEAADSCSTPAPKIGRPFEVDFESNMPAQQLQQPTASSSEDKLYLEEMQHRLKCALKSGVPELGDVIRTLKAAKPLQVEPCIALLYHKLRRHAQALHAARRANVAIVAHKPSFERRAADQQGAEQAAPFESSPLSVRM